MSGANDSEPSFVLDDVVRAGQASRLRRRGALRLDTARASTSLALGASSADAFLSSLVSAAHASAAQPQHRLFCGARVWTHGLAPVPSPLPGLVEPVDQPWSGCRALVHSGAVPSVRDGTWFARGAAERTVVPLSEAYFERGGRRLRRSCGCAADGVGCSVCGNALGSVYRPCARHLRLFSAGACPLYSFFAAATDADPPFPFPAPTVAPSPLNLSAASPEDEPDDLLDSPKF